MESREVKILVLNQGTITKVLCLSIFWISKCKLSILLYCHDSGYIDEENRLLYLIYDELPYGRVFGVN
jgi:hypothetical protein